MKGMYKSPSSRITPRPIFLDSISPSSREIDGEPGSVGHTSQKNPSKLRNPQFKHSVGNNTKIVATPEKYNNAPISGESSLLAFVRNRRGPRLGVARTTAPVNTISKTSKVEKLLHSTAKLPLTKAKGKAASERKRPQSDGRGKATDRCPDSKGLLNKRTKTSDTGAKGIVILENDDDHLIGEKTWFNPELRSLKRSVNRPDLDPKHPEFWHEIAKCVNQAILGRNKNKRQLKTADECSIKYKEINAQAPDTEPAPKKIAVAKKADKSVMERLKGNTKAWELNKIVNERAFNEEKIGLKLFNKKAMSPVSKELALTSNYTKKQSSNVDNMLNDWVKGTPDKKISVFKDTPLGESALLMARRSSVDWDALTNMGQEVIGATTVIDETILNDKLSTSARSSVCELYQDLDNPQKLDHVRGLQKMQKILRKVPSGLGGGVLKPSFDGPGLKDKFKAKSFLEKKDAVAVISSLIGEYDALCAEYNETGGPDRDTLIKEALTIAEEIITSAEQLNMVQMGSDWELLSSSNDLKEYNSFVQTIKSEVAKFWSIA